MLPRTVLMLPAQIPRNSRWKHQNLRWKHQIMPLAASAAAGMGQTMLPRTALMLPAQIPWDLRWKHQHGAWQHPLPQHGRLARCQP
jgi:hypothetical protein